MEAILFLKFLGDKTALAKVSWALIQCYSAPALLPQHPHQPDPVTLGTWWRGEGPLTWDLESWVYILAPSLRRWGESLAFSGRSQLPLCLKKVGKNHPGAFQIESLDPSGWNDLFISDPHLLGTFVRKLQAALLGGDGVSHCWSVQSVFDVARMLCLSSRTPSPWGTPEWSLIRAPPRSKTTLYLVILRVYNLMDRLSLQASWKLQAAWGGDQGKQTKECFSRLMHGIQSGPWPQIKMPRTTTIPREGSYAGHPSIHWTHSRCLAVFHIQCHWCFWMWWFVKTLGDSQMDVRGPPSLLVIAWVLETGR
jgi:hypothetical protein